MKKSEEAIYRMVDDVNGTRVKRWLMTTILVGSVLVMFTVVASADTIYVPRDYSKIQWAVDNASSGDTIIVQDGTYTENVRVKNKPNLTIRSENGSANCTIKALSDNTHCIEVYGDANHVNITGFTLTGANFTDWGNKPAGIGINTRDQPASCDFLIISDNIITGNTYGILAIATNNCMFINNTIFNNTYGISIESTNRGTVKSANNNTLINNSVYSNSECGICIIGEISGTSDNNTLINNSVCSNSRDATTNQAGIYMSWTNNNTFINNIVNNNYRYGIHMENSNNNSFINNIANSNKNDGIYMSWTNNNTFINNTANNNYRYGIHMENSNNNSFINNTANYNQYDGIHMENSNNNSFINNTANYNQCDGIGMGDSNNNTLINNTANYNYYGICMFNSSNNNVSCNWVHNNSGRGFDLGGGSTGNTIEHNNIITNGELQSDGSYHYQFYNDQSDAVEAKYNFWGYGMTDDKIDASIYDDEEGKGKVTFLPRLTGPSPCAPVPELPTVVLTILGLVSLTGYLKLRTRKYE